MPIDWEVQHHKLSEIIESHAKFLDQFCNGIIDKGQSIIGIKHFKDSVDSHFAGLKEDESYETD